MASMPFFYYNDKRTTFSTIPVVQSEPDSLKR
jgi:hypothetical protein